MLTFIIKRKEERRKRRREEGIKKEGQQMDR